MLLNGRRDDRPIALVTRDLYSCVAAPWIYEASAYTMMNADDRRLKPKRSTDGAHEQTTAPQIEDRYGNEKKRGRERGGGGGGISMEERWGKKEADWKRNSE